MAAAIACDICGEETAVMMQSNLTNGDSQAIGQACLLTFALTCSLAFAEGIPPDVAAGYGELLAAVVERIQPDLLAPAKPGKAPRKRSAPAEPPADPTGAATPDADAPAASSTNGQPADSLSDADLGAFDMAPGQ